MNRPVNVKNLSFFLLLCLLAFSSLTRAQSILPDTLGLVNKPMTFYFTYRAEPFTDLSYMHFKFREVNDHQLMNSYYKYQKTHKATRITSAAGAFLIGFAGAALLLNTRRQEFDKPPMYALLGTGIVTTGVSIWLERKSIKHARKVVGRYNSLVR
ncbi:hypothetical protein [uncultured Imperialibacter sp.]|uniref:hypothetical protein n=1 Tax=uncultured Imperialibacter sp. TaxID=1672639 RepID=UPI0030DAE4FE|tara:strand:+ start:13873 stop:14337 length:465 start_codon:yes stop_codon:yes gene_type:complete